MFTININPVAFSIGSIEVRWYGIMIALAVITLLLITLREAKRVSISQDTVYNLFLWGIIGGFIGARLIVVQWDHYLAHPEDILNFIGFPAFSLYGAIIGPLIAVWVYTRVKKAPFQNLAGVGDAVAVGAPLAQAIGRVGCTINGCCYGKPTSLPWAVIYANQHSGCGFPGIPLHPTQIYFLLWNLVVFAVVWRLRGRLKQQGSLFLLYLCLYAAGDFSLRFFRVNEVFIFGLHQGQIISLAILAVVLPLFIRRMRRTAHEERSASSG